MATNTSGNKDLDSYRTGKLCLDSMNLAQEILSAEGVFLSKLFMGSIFNEINEKKNEQSEETNLNSVLLLNPQNEQALYMLTLLKIKQSDYDQAKLLIENFYLVCKSICSKKSELQEKLEIVTPENAKSND